MGKETGCETSFLAPVGAGTHTVGFHANAGNGIGGVPIVTDYYDAHLWALYIPFDSTGN